MAPHTMLEGRALRQPVFSSGRPRSKVSAGAAKGSAIGGIQHDLRSKQRSAVEIASVYIEQIQRTNEALNSFITVDAEKALQQVGGCR